MMNERQYRNIVVAVHSPANGCFVPEGEVLTIRPRRSVRMSTVVSHHFVGTKSPRLKARFGWVLTRAPFTLQQFFNDYYEFAPTEQLDQDHVIEMLAAVDRLSLGMTVGADYFQRGLPPKMEFSVHRVIMFDSRDTKARD